ncbi:replication protein A 70 kDa DNA-binding subunit B [Artemisia annua]|uniref:Replication protein A 70 kDa DNA-binding subunit B n=1 Tax=Artemisia annua TaxID=35608 RepID=A0A2U1KB06_ARTAN|nr:replication protein A 70 kDa DNA-binding subunit B [Artemisia annua]
MSNSNPKTFLQGRRKKQKHSSLTPMFNCDISYLDEITNNEECSTIKVKIIHIWKTTSTLWGNKINACANHYVLKLCQPMLKKDNCILLSNFNLYTGLEGMQLTNHVGKIYFKNNTSISVVQDFNCAHDGFEFIEYHDIVTDEKYNKLAFDIIGLISSKPKLKEIYYRKKTTIISEFKLQNLNGDEVNVTLWEDNADKLDNYLSQEYIQNEPVVLVFQLAKINTWGTPIDAGDLSTVKHGNACDVTVINISVDEDEAQCSESAPIDDGDLSTVKHGNACDVTVINISDDEDEIYAAGLNGYRSTPILKKPKQNEQYVYNISDDDIDLHDTDNEVGCFAGTSHGFSKSTFQRGKNICKIDDYFEYEIDENRIQHLERFGDAKVPKGRDHAQKWVYSVNLHVVTHEQDHSQIKALVLEGNWDQFGQDYGFEEEKILRIKLVRYEVQKLDDEILKIPIFHVC